MKIIIAENFLGANTLNRDDKQAVFLMCRGYSRRQYFISTYLLERPRKGNFGVWTLTFSTFFLYCRRENARREAYLVPRRCAKTIFLESENFLVQTNFVGTKFFQFLFFKFLLLPRTCVKIILLEVENFRVCKILYFGFWRQVIKISLPRKYPDTISCTQVLSRN